MVVHCLVALDGGLRTVNGAAGLMAARERHLATVKVYDAKPAVKKHRHEQYLERKAAGYYSRVCPDCGGSRAIQSKRCLACSRHEREHKRSCSTHTPHRHCNCGLPMEIGLTRCALCDLEAARGACMDPTTTYSIEERAANGRLGAAKRWEKPYTVKKILARTKTEEASDHYREYQREYMRLYMVKRRAALAAKKEAA